MPHALETEVYYEGTDCGNVAYYATYLKYMERGRTEYLVGFFQVYETLGYGFLEKVYENVLIIELRKLGLERD